METILIADDDQDTRNIIKFILHRAGYNVLEATKGKVALELIIKEQPALAILDLNMPPGIGGLEICELLRENPTGLETPVLILSANPDRNIGLPPGVARMVKPFSNKDLLEKVEYLKRKAINDENGTRTFSES